SVGGLKLTCTVDKERYESKEPITFTATVENVSDHEIVFHKNEDSGLIGFPTFRITGAGRDWHLHVAPFQTLVREGMVGALETLAPGTTRSYPIKVEMFTQDDPRSPHILPEGDYSVTATYEKKDNLVEFNGQG